MSQESKDNKLISIIIPVYNAETYIEKCIQSIRKQSYTELEIVIVNDGSTDKSREICEDFRKQDTRIRIVNKENEGAAAAKNTGLDEANGDFLMFVDSDDYIENDMIEEMFKKLNAASADICICNFIQEKTDGVPCEDSSQMLHFGDRVFSGFEMLELLNGDLWWRLCQPCTKLYRKELFSDIRFPLQVVEDLAVMHLLYDKCQKVCFADKAFYHYVQQESSVLHTRQVAVVLDVIKILEERIMYYEKKGYVTLIPGTELLLYDKMQSGSAIVDLSNRTEKERFFKLRNTYWKVLEIARKYKKFSAAARIKRQMISRYPRLYQVYLRYGRSKRRKVWNEA